MQSLLKENKLTAEQKPMLVPPSGKVLLYKPKIEITTTPITTTVSPFIELREQFEKYLLNGDNEGCEYILDLMNRKDDPKYIECKRRWEEKTRLIAESEERLIKSIQNNPSCTSIHIELLEIYLKQRLIQKFETTASELYAVTSGHGADWQIACQMGKELDPKNPLYQENHSDTKLEEVNVKIDLAKAYAEMGYIDGANRVLDECKIEGNEVQLLAAKKIINLVYKEKNRKLAEVESKRKIAEAKRAAEIELAKKVQDLIRQNTEAEEIKSRTKAEAEAKRLVEAEANRKTKLEQVKKKIELAMQEEETKAQRKAEEAERERALAARNIIEGAMGHRYEIIGDGSMVKDLNTGLIWQRYSVGQSWDGWTFVGAARVFIFDEAQKLAKDGWRLPTVRELFSLVESSSGQIGQYETDIGDGGGVIKDGCLGDYQRPTINAQAFPVTQDYVYWTSTDYKTVSGRSWVVFFGNGVVNDGNHGSSNLVRLVRSVYGQ